MAQATDFRIDTSNLAFESGESIENYAVAFKRPFRKAKRFQLLFASIPKSLYMTNDTPTFSLNRAGAGAVAITLPARSYASGTELATEMQTAIRAAIGAASSTTVTFDPSTGKLTIAEGSTTFAITDVAYPFTDISGFNGTDAATADMPATNVVDLTWPRSLGIRLTVQDIGVRGISTPSYEYTYHVPMATTNFGQIEEYSDDASWDQLGHQTNIFPDFDTLKVQWLLPNGQPMLTNCFNGAHHELLLRVWSMTGRGYA